MGTLHLPLFLSLTLLESLLNPVSVALQNNFQKVDAPTADEGQYTSKKLSVEKRDFEHEGYEIVTPVEIHPEKKRTKRGINASNPSTIIYSVKGFGENFLMELKPNSGLLARDFAVYRRLTGSKTGQHTLVDHPKQKCFYVGRLKSHNNSYAAISSCNGLQGLIRTETHDFLIEPMKEAFPWSAEGIRPHVLYKRSIQPQHVNNNASKNHPSQIYFCGSKDEYMPHAPKHRYLFPDEYPFLRSRRSTFSRLQLKDRKVETLVVVDHEMVKAHGVENITTYVLTIFNMVAALYNDGTIGNNISVVLVALVLLEGDEPGLVLSNNAERSLHSFCQWQSTLRDANGSHHDHAILLTGLDICSWKNEPCDTLGYAPISGMCSKYRSCTINEDTGLALAFTIAHESGHNFGMVHDGDGNICGNTQGSIMSPTLTGLDGTFSWSACSRKDLNKFLNSAQSNCLENEPRRLGEFRFPNILPGELYDADMQCKWQFGKSSKLCRFEFGKDICKALWCQKTGRQCETKFLPAAEGTSCGHKKWCRRGVCVDYGDHGPIPVDGQWSEWSEWSVCTRTCGGGITYQERECNNPRPQFGGKYCDGETRLYKLCNIQNCPPDTINFRAEQCAAFNSKPFRGGFYHWIPYSKGLSESARCKLYCMPEGLDFFFALSSKVIDGTPCQADSSNVCVDGECKEVGCDYIIGSESRLDACGVCKGDNSTCTFVSGNYTEQPITNNYYTVAVIPKKARSIHVQELNMSASYLAMRNSSNYYYLTGDWTVDWPGKYKVGKAVFQYRRPYNGPETLYSDGPLEEEITIELLLQGINPGIFYEYTIPKQKLVNLRQHYFHPHHYVWRAIVSECSEQCAEGEMITTAQCFRNDNQQVDNSFCDISIKPEEGISKCNNFACPPNWIPEEWSPCTRPCGGGRQKRKVRCIVKVNSTYDIIVKPKLCNAATRPPRKQRCNKNECPPTWQIMNWSQCSKTCGGGTQTRNVTCQGKRRKSYILPDRMCKHQEKPEESQICGLRRCPRQPVTGLWVASTWGRCSRTCNSGQQRRLVRCVDRISHRETDFSMCNSALRPKHVQRCNLLPCPSSLSYSYRS